MKRRKDVGAPPSPETIQKELTFATKEQCTRVGLSLRRPKKLPGAFVALASVVHGTLKLAAGQSQLREPQFSHPRSRTPFNLPSRSFSLSRSDCRAPCAPYPSPRTRGYIRYWRALYTVLPLLAPEQK